MPKNKERVLSILELTSLDDTNSQVCPVRLLATYLRASKGRRKPIRVTLSSFKTRSNNVPFHFVKKMGLGSVIDSISCVDKGKEKHLKVIKAAEEEVIVV
ncbi:hypothetical protein ACTFIW_010436 [Dictyostelium discoideum]